MDNSARQPVSWLEMERRVSPSIDTIPFVGGRLCLDFVNTANRLEGEACDERLTSFDDVLVLGRRLGLIDTAAGARLAKRAADEPAAAAAGLAEVVDLRDGLWRLFAQPDDDRTADLARLNQAIGDGGALKLVMSGGGLAIDAGDDLTAWLSRPVAYSALELLTSARLTRVKTCPGMRCSWIFLDESPNASRRWCSMETCGNRAKARRFYRAHGRPSPG